MNSPVKETVTTALVGVTFELRLECEPRNDSDASASLSAGSASCDSDGSGEGWPQALLRVRPRGPLEPR